MVDREHIASSGVVLCLHLTERSPGHELRSQSVTELLVAWSNGDETALESLTPLIYGELHRLARRYMRHENPGHTLQTTALVNEAYLRLVKQKQANWQNRAHFFAVSAQAMRHILVDMARGRSRLSMEAMLRTSRSTRLWSFQKAGPRS